jgi:hypothetical protein
MALGWEIQPESIDFEVLVVVYPSDPSVRNMVGLQIEAIISIGWSASAPTPAMSRRS